MKIKVYRVYLKDDPSVYYLVEAPSKRIARWCGAACFINEYAGFRTAKDMIAERFFSTIEED